MDIKKFIQSLTEKEFYELKHYLSNGSCNIDEFIDQSMCSVRLMNSLKLYERIYEIKDINEIEKILFIKLPRTGMKTWDELDYFAMKYGIAIK